MTVRAALRHDFASDNRAGLAPEVIEWLGRAASGFSAAYGADSLTARAADLVRDLLDVDAEVFFTMTGTAANSIALAALCRPFESIIAHRHAHIVVDETGAPGFFGHGLGVLPLDGPSGRIEPATLAQALCSSESPHQQSPGVLALSNATEFGTVYSTQELETLTGLAKSEHAATFLDGARLANAAASGFSLKSLRSLAVDIAVLGGSKAGMPPTEAIVLFDRGLARRFLPRLKQSGQLAAKSRYCAAPWIAMLESGTWLERARHANAMARRLAAAIPFEVAHPVEANAVYVRMSEEAHSRLNARGWVALRMGDGTVRFMCSWATTSAGVDELVEVLKTCH